MRCWPSCDSSSPGPPDMENDKAAELRRSKRLALFFLLAAGAVFIVTAFLPHSLWTDGLKAVSEAAMVGALADWFAVTALFRTIPIPFISRHTNIIPREKDRIAVNLAKIGRAHV